jgi:hypothetical protein
MNIEKRLKKIEDKVSPSCPGTSISRAMHPEKGFMWCVGIGTLHQPKHFFYGKTIEKALTKAEKFVVEQ